MTILTPEIAMPLVEAGGRWLDERDHDWLRGIDKERLDLGSVSSCTLAQRAEALTRHTWENSYTGVLSYFGLSGEWASKNGFTVGLEYLDDGACYEVLTLCWLQYITSRLEGLAQ